MIKKGFVFGPDGERQSAATALEQREITPLAPGGREGQAHQWCLRCTGPGDGCVLAA